jgi:WD40 repeat protein/serine/threonine protein kinase
MNERFVHYLSMRDADRLIEIYHEATTWPPGPERERFLLDSCGDDTGLKEQVVSLLQSHQNAGGFLQEPIFPPIPVVSEKLGDAIGRYKLLEKLGEGGCGVVYVAEQTQPVRRRVALKVIKLGMDTKQVITRFEAERQALAMMDHTNIARVLDAGSTETGRPYFVMDLVRGLRITDYCDQNNLSIPERLDLFTKVCHAIQHAHQKGVIHRDIKPSNILVTLHDGVPVPKVIDFGIAKATEGRLAEASIYTQFLHFVGTPAYMSPEQAEMSGLDIDTRSDIYSLGVLLYELLTGQTPFDGEKLVASGIDAMRKTIREKEPVRPSTRVSQALGKFNPPSKLSVLHAALSTDLDWIVMKCLEKDRTRRYDTANGLAADLNRHLNNEPVSARPPSAAYKLQKAWRRNKVKTVAVAVVVISLLLGTGASIWQAFQAKYHSYVANINLAGRAMEHNNVEQLRRLLTETRTFSQRGFEWYYWQRQAHLNLATLRGHTSYINSVAVSPDGRRIVTASNDHTARVWDAATGRQLLMLIGHTNGLSCAAFSPDGKWITTGSGDKSVRVWDAVTGLERFKHLGHELGVTWVAFSPDSLRIVSASHDGTAKVWEAPTDREPLTFRGHGSDVLCAAFSPNGARIITGGVDRRTRIWDATSTEELHKIEGHTDSILSVQFSGDGKRVLTGSLDGTARVWDSESGWNPTTILNVGAPVSAAVFSPEGRRIVTGSYDSLATVWDAASGARLLNIGADSMAVMSVAFSPGSEWIVTGGGEGDAKVWEASTDQQSIVLRGNDSPVLAVDFSLDGQRIVTGGGNYDALATPIKESGQVWDTASGRKLFKLEGHKAGISSATFSPDGRWILTGSGDQTARLWSAVNGQEVRKFEGHTGIVYSVAFSANSQRIVTGSADRTAKMWDLDTGQVRFDMEGHIAEIRTVAISPNGHWIATGDWEGTVIIWDAIHRRKERSLTHSHLVKTLGLAFSPDSQRLVACGWPRSAMVWNVASGQCLFELRGHRSPVNSPAFSPDGRRIVTSSWDRCAKLWDAKTGLELLSLDDTGDALSAVAFSRDGRRIVTGNRNKTARIWESAQPDQVAAWDMEERSARVSRDGWQE